MIFTESIKTCFGKYADFKGRAIRSEYWWFFLFTTLVGAGMFAVDCGLLEQCGHHDGVFGWLWALAILLPCYAAGARRLHDSGRSGWWQLLEIPFWIGYAMPDEETAGITFVIGFAAIIPVIVMLCFRTWPETNQHGEPPLT